MISNYRSLGAGRYGLSQLQIGDKIETRQLSISAELIDTFAHVTGDYFEIHMSTQAAKKHGFTGRVAHGLLILSLVDGLKNQTEAQFDAIASLGWEVCFTSPVMLGDTIQATIRVTDLRQTSNLSRGIVTIEVTTKNQRDEIVQRATNKLMVYT